jgi:hypothetical protein
MGDWDYINEHMGGHDEDGLSNFMSSPCFNDDWEHELRDAGYKTVNEWNSLDRSIKKGEKGRYLPCAKISVFNGSQTDITNCSKDKYISGMTGGDYFETFEEAKFWTRENPGRVITKSPTGKGYIKK